MKQQFSESASLIYQLTEMVNGWPESGFVSAGSETLAGCLLASVSWDFLPPSCFPPPADFSRWDFLGLPSESVKIICLSDITLESTWEQAMVCFSQSVGSCSPYRLIYWSGTLLAHTPFEWAFTIYNKTRQRVPCTICIKKIIYAKRMKC